MGILIAAIQLTGPQCSANSPGEIQCALKSLLYSADQSRVLYLLLLQCIPQVQSSAVLRPISSVVFAVQPFISHIAVVSAIQCSADDPQEFYLQFSLNSFLVHCIETSSAVSSVHIILECFIGVWCIASLFAVHPLVQYSAVCRSFLSFGFAVMYPNFLIAVHPLMQYSADHS